MHLVSLFVSFPLRMVVDLKPEQESATAAKVRAERLAWLKERDYCVLAVAAGDVAHDASKVLDEIDAKIAEIRS